MRRRIVGRWIVRRRRRWLLKLKLKETIND